MDREVAATLADGRIFSGRQALEVGLIDGIGDLHGAINIAAGMAGLPPEPRVESKARMRIPLLDMLDQLFRDGARATWGPRLEYRLP